MLLCRLMSQTRAAEDVVNMDSEQKGMCLRYCSARRAGPQHLCSASTGGAPFARHVFVYALWHGRHNFLMWRSFSFSLKS